ncbi:uncharacterized protein ATNIH1004_010542 [Aspergillus tanneri]|uniref:Uncharacterized protein n=1 Tax=Aspergillus tanneri TaxID=1220188 RepID=A0A5M9MA48_9EURO|nr:uncharacterized protein ATNIH1004_010542 [Aspergillus tanneri]KAA8643768.1 hypothetical protein ATNIH1004_010542 [Aspergillus tanneri]
MLPRCQCWALSRDELTTPTVVLYEYEHGYSAMVAAFPAAFTKATSVVVDMLVTVAFTELYALGWLFLSLTPGLELGVAMFISLNLHEDPDWVSRTTSWSRRLVLSRNNYIPTQKTEQCLIEKGQTDASPSDFVIVLT